MWMQFAVQKLYASNIGIKTEGRFLLPAKIKKERTVDLPFHLKQLTKLGRNNEIMLFNDIGQWSWDQETNEQ